MRNQKENYIATARHEKPNYVVVSPNTYFNFPVTLSPFSHIDYELGYADPFEAKSNCAKRFNYVDKWTTEPYFIPTNETKFIKRVREIKERVINIEERINTMYGDYCKVVAYRKDNVSHVREYPKLDLGKEKDLNIMRSMLEGGFLLKTEEVKLLDKRCGTYLVPYGNVDLFIHMLFSLVGAETGIMNCYENPSGVDKLWEIYSKYALGKVREELRAGLEQIYIQGSYSSMSVSSPELYQRYDSPLVEEITKLAHRNGAFVHIHICGRSRETIPLNYRAGVDVQEPIETPPMGNCNISEIMQKFGDKMCFKGGVDPVRLRFDNPTQIGEKIREIFEAVDTSKNFILSTGDQVAGDTPIENFETMLEVGKKYGGYYEIIKSK